jgi:predicted signal transduction protein with EAL and GGDEF domain
MAAGIEDAPFFAHPQDANRILAEWTRPPGGAANPPPNSRDTFVVRRGDTVSPSREELERQIARNARRSPRGLEMVAVLVVELAGFADLHGALGDDAAANLLQEATERFGRVRGTNAFHLDGAIFVVTTGPLRSRFDALMVARRVQRRLEQPFMVADGAVNLGAHIGVRVSVDGARRQSELVIDAAFARDQAKRRGGAEPVLYVPQMRDRMR